MFTYFKNGIKNITWLLVLALAPCFIKAQPVSLKAEMDILSGLQSNAVRVIKKDKLERLWLGTYSGLLVLNNSDPFVDSLQLRFLNQPVWALEFYYDYAIIGTRFNGLHIADLEKNKIIATIDSASIGLIRKFRLVRDTLYIATRANPYYLPMKTLKLHKVKSPDAAGFATDFAEWEGNIETTYYKDTFSYVYQMKADTLEIDPRFDLYQFPRIGNTLSVESDSQNLIIGGNGFNITMNSEGEIRSETLINTSTEKRMPIWDIEFALDKVYTVTGDPDNTQQGMIHEPFITQGDDLHNNFYGLSLYFDKRNNGLWAGTENSGLFYWPAATSFYHVPHGLLENFKYYETRDGRTILFDNDLVYLADLKANKFDLAYRQTDVQKNGNIVDVKAWNDTIAILTLFKLILRKGDRVILNKSLFRAMYNIVDKRAGNIELFSLYSDGILTIDANTFRERLIKAAANQISKQFLRNNIIYHSTYTGFMFFDTVPRVLYPKFPSAESFALSNDTLWLLNSGVLSSYHIRLDKDSLEKINEFNFKTRFKSFSPKWLVSVNNKIYCGNNKGFIEMNSKSNLPGEYFYLGNFSEGVNPKVFNDTIFFQHTNYLAKITPADLKFQIDPSKFIVRTSPSGKINENSPFIIEIKTNDHLIQKHSLKQFLLVDNENDSSIFFTTDDKYDLASGLKRGTYELVIKVNGIEVSRNKIKVVIPVTSNPIFYFAIILFLAAFTGLWVRYLLNKKRYEKQILDNRLQLLKQNLNPHFVFNSLNLIYSLVLQNKNDAAIKTINNFSDLHRYYLDNISKGKVKLTEELAFIESYLKLEAERREVDDPFIYHLPDQSVDGNEYMVPPMILQPLVENAVKYCGPDPSISSQSMIWIDVERANGHLVISIENTLNIQNQKSILRNGLGLKLVEERVDIYNKFYRQNVTMAANVPCKRTPTGYRTEIRI